MGYSFPNHELIIKVTSYKHGIAKQKGMFMFLCHDNKCNHLRTPVNGDILMFSSLIIAEMLWVWIIFIG